MLPILYFLFIKNHFVGKMERKITLTDSETFHIEILREPTLHFAFGGMFGWFDGEEPPGQESTSTFKSFILRTDAWFRSCRHLRDTKENFRSCATKCEEWIAADNVVISLEHIESSKSKLAFSIQGK